MKGSLKDGMLAAVAFVSIAATGVVCWLVEERIRRWRLRRRLRDRG